MTSNYALIDILRDINSTKKLLMASIGTSDKNITNYAARIHNQFIDVKNEARQEGYQYAYQQLTGEEGLNPPADTGSKVVIPDVEYEWDETYEGLIDIMEIVLDARLAMKTELGISSNVFSTYPYEIERVREEKYDDGYEEGLLAAKNEIILPPPEIVCGDMGYTTITSDIPGAVIYYNLNEDVEYTRYTQPVILQQGDEIYAHIEVTIENVTFTSIDAYYGRPSFKSQYITFESTNGSAASIYPVGVGMTIPAGSFLMSYDDGSTWTALNANTPAVLNQYDKVLVKANFGSAGLVENNTPAAGKYIRFQIDNDGTADIKVYGNSSSLLYGDNFMDKNNPAIGRYGLQCLFGRDMLNTPAWNINSFDAENLVFPKISASSDHCFYHLFEGCSSLIKAPELPSTTLAQYCYSGMFNFCTGLTKAPALPATTLAVGCYGSMFDHCSSLEIVPELPATSLATECYSGMFAACISLETAPELPATHLIDYCYFNMFAGCSSLNYIKSLAQNWNYLSTSGWVTGVNSTGTYIKYKYVNYPYNDSGIPTGWTVIEVE